MLKTDISNPAGLSVISKASISTGISGGTLFWVNGAARLAKKTTIKMIQA
jgi:hypothetical protein